MNQSEIRNPKSEIRNRAAVMSEMVFVMPLLLVITSLVIWFGLLAVRVQHTQVMARYETWRNVINSGVPESEDDDSNGAGDMALGPYSDGSENSTLSSAFFASKANDLTRTTNDTNYPTDSYDQLVSDAGQLSNDAGMLAEALMYLPPDNTDIRMSHGQRDGFKVTYTTDVPLWTTFEGPIRRHSARIGTDWAYVDDWRASPDRWLQYGSWSRLGQVEPDDNRSDPPNDAAGHKGGVHAAPTPHHARALRDVFLKDFDDQLDAIDGDTNPEYPGDSTQVPSGQALAGFIRSLYLQEPAYRGPIVYDEKP